MSQYYKYQLVNITRYHDYFIYSFEQPCELALLAQIADEEIIHCPNLYNLQVVKLVSKTNSLIMKHTFVTNTQIITSYYILLFFGRIH